MFTKQTLLASFAVLGMAFNASANEGAVGRDSLLDLAKSGDLNAEKNAIYDKIESEGIFRAAAQGSTDWYDSRVFFVVDDLKSADNLAESIGRIEHEILVEPATLAKGVVGAILALPVRLFNKDCAKKLAKSGGYQVTSVGTDLVANVAKFLPLGFSESKRGYIVNVGYYVIKEGGEATIYAVKSEAVLTYTFAVDLGTSVADIGKTFVKDIRSTNKAFGNLVSTGVSNVGNIAGKTVEYGLAVPFVALDLLWKVTGDPIVKSVKKSKAKKAAQQQSGK